MRPAEVRAELRDSLMRGLITDEAHEVERDQDALRLRRDVERVRRARAAHPAGAGR